MTKRNKRLARFPLGHEMIGRPVTVRDLQLNTTYKLTTWIHWKKGRQYSAEWVTCAGVIHPLRSSKRQLSRWRVVPPRRIPRKD